MCKEKVDGEYFGCFLCRTDFGTFFSLRFSPCSGFLAVASDKDTVHIFAVKNNDPTWTNRKTLYVI